MKNLEISPLLLAACVATAAFPLGCGDPVGVTVTDSTSDTDPSTTDPSTTDSSTTDPSTTDPTTSTTGTAEPGTSTGEPWEVDACLTRFSWDCETSSNCPPPMPVPFHACGANMLCNAIEVKTQGKLDAYEVVETEADALCVLQALRDRTPGQVQITWGDPQGFAGDVAVAIHATVTILGDDAVLMDWTWEDFTCCVNTAAVSRRVALQPPSFFDDCLAMPTTESLLDCFTAGSTVNDPAPDGWLPPWTLGTCDGSMAPSCPG